MRMDLSRQIYMIKKSYRSSKVAGSQGNRVTREIIYIHVCVGVCE